MITHDMHSITALRRNRDEFIQLKNNDPSFAIEMICKYSSFHALNNNNNKHKVK